ncbi:hypothetical protein ACJX0J_033257, partial [Zea mays]
LIALGLFVPNVDSNGQNQSEAEKSLNYQTHELKWTKPYVFSILRLRGCLSLTYVDTGIPQTFRACAWANPISIKVARSLSFLYFFS